MKGVRNGMDVEQGGMSDRSSPPATMVGMVHDNEEAWWR